MRIATRVGRLACLAVALATLCGTRAATAQDLEPKAYAASPVGAAFLVAGFGRSTGSVVFDPSLPVTDVEAKVSGALLAGGYSFGLGRKLALATWALPYAWGSMTGKINEDAASIGRSGLGDARLKLSVNLWGNPAMRAGAFRKAPRRTIVGTSVTVVAPSGQYYGSKLINIGTNRWAFKPEIGVSIPKGRWDIDGYVGVWLFTGNSDFYPGGRARSQAAVTALQGHLSYTFKPRLWAALDATWYRGGSATAEGAAPSAAMNNARLGWTLAVPVTPRQSLKVALSRGIVVRTGTDFTALSVGYQWLWLTKK